MSNAGLTNDGFGYWTIYYKVLVIGRSTTSSGCLMEKATARAKSTEYHEIGSGIQTTDPASNFMVPGGRFCLYRRSSRSASGHGLLRRSKTPEASAARSPREAW